MAQDGGKGHSHAKNELVLSPGIVSEVKLFQYACTLEPWPLAGPEKQYVVDNKGRKTSVILPVKRYQQLMEDIHDLAVVAERRDEEPMSLKANKRNTRVQQKQV